MRLMDWLPTHHRIFGSFHANDLSDLPISWPYQAMHVLLAEQNFGFFHLELTFRFASLYNELLTT